MNYGKAVHEHYMVSFFTFVSSPWNNNEACSLNKVISYNRMKALGWRGLYFSLQARASTALWSDSAPLWSGEGGRAETALCSGSLTFEGGQGWKGHETMNTFRWPHRKKFVCLEGGTPWAKPNGKENLEQSDDSRSEGCFWAQPALVRISALINSVNSGHSFVDLGSSHPACKTIMVSD